MTGILYLGDNSTNFRDNRKTLLFDCFQSIDVHLVGNLIDVIGDTGRSRIADTISGLIR
ncbi:hypothetical protein M069_1303 [Bacteroides fragilis str. B1 (UDC16-1)]|nr:hypothetical protein M069_1303 [Bacteroides fragilis str. B1 (UDC16-1)]